MIYLSDQTGWKQTQCKVTMGDDAGIASTYHFRIRNLGGGGHPLPVQVRKKEKKVPRKKGAGVRDGAAGGLCRGKARCVCVAQQNRTDMFLQRARFYSGLTDTQPPCTQVLFKETV